MESMQDILQLIKDAKNVCIIPSENDGESVPNALAFFYTLKELGKNVNLIIDSVPEKFRFLVPSLDFISTPKNFVISIPRESADISQVYYEKSETNLKIHLTVDKGSLKKDQIAFYYSEARPDVIIALGIQDFHQQLSKNLDSFGFLLDVPIINIDTDPSNKQFGIANIVQQRSLSEINWEIINSLGENLVKQHAANCLLAGLTSSYHNFQKPDINPEIFELCASLMKRGANRQQILEHLYPKTTPASQDILPQEEKNLNIITS
jgi:nanoRNase/pAp phosphatase (c-di-AMP/oligoRNAs hydrolase)